MLIKDLEEVVNFLDVVIQNTKPDNFCNKISDDGTKSTLGRRVELKFHPDFEIELKKLQFRLQRHIKTFQEI